ncbi:MAG: chromosome segregation ATPase [Bacteriovoracaceae bacterium]|jgi:chromosome segregation ATPase
MRKIYQSFEELLKQNQGLFSLLRKKEGRKMDGTFRAIWDARQAEIDEFKVAVDELYKQINFEQKQSKEYKSLLEKSLKENADQEERLNKLSEFLSISTTEFADELFQKEKMISYLNKKFEERLAFEETLNSEIQKKERFSRSLESAFNMAQSQIGHESEVIENKEKAVAEQSVQIDLLLKEIKNLKNKNQEVNQELENTLKELEESKSYARQYKMINNKMSNELHRLNNKVHELDPFQ